MEATAIDVSELSEEQLELSAKENTSNSINQEPRSISMSPIPPPSSPYRFGACVDLCLVGGVAITTGPCLCTTCGSGCIGCLASLCVGPVNYIVGASWGLLSCGGECWGPAREERAKRVRYIGKVWSYRSEGESIEITVNGRTKSEYV